MHARSLPIRLALPVVALVAAACTAGPAAPASPGSRATSPGPDPTPVIDRPPLATPGPSAAPIAGGVDGAIGGPELTIVPLDEDTIEATLDDPAAKAWRLVVAGVGDRDGDRWEIVVETGDVTPLITATEIRDGAVVDVLDLAGFRDGPAVAGGCHSTLPVCLDSAGFTLPSDGDGRFAVRLDVLRPAASLLVRGGTATWEGEPFVLGPWRDTEAFPWGEG
jgi:hypothetical protein